MKFCCEYCGASIDASVEKKCPNCGAPYQDNASYIKMEAEKKDIERQNQEFVSNVQKHVASGMKISGIVFVIVGIVALIIIGFVLYTMIKMMGMMGH